MAPQELRHAIDFALREVTEKLDVDPSTLVKLVKAGLQFALSMFFTHGDNITLIRRGSLGRSPVALPRIVCQAGQGICICKPEIVCPV
jgi:hypothetical protein